MHKSLSKKMWKVLYLKLFWQLDDQIWDQLDTMTSCHITKQLIEEMDDQLWNKIYDQLCTQLEGEINET